GFRVSDSLCLLLLVRGDIDQHPAAGPAEQLPSAGPPEGITGRGGRGGGGGSGWMGGMSEVLSFVPALSRTDLLAAPVAAALRDWPGTDEVLVAEIDPALADTAAFCEGHGVSPTE